MMAYEMRMSDWSTDVCSSYLSLRPLRRHGLSAVRRVLLLGTVRQPACLVRTTGPLDVLADVCRIQRELFPDALHGPGRHAAPCLHVCGEPGVGATEFFVDCGRLYDRRRGAGIPGRYGAQFSPNQWKERRKHLAGRHFG